MPTPQPQQVWWKMIGLPWVLSQAIIKALFASRAHHMLNKGFSADCISVKSRKMFKDTKLKRHQVIYLDPCRYDVQQQHQMFGTNLYNPLQLPFSPRRAASWVIRAEIQQSLIKRNHQCWNTSSALSVCQLPFLILDAEKHCVAAHHRMAENATEQEFGVCCCASSGGFYQEGCQTPQLQAKQLESFHIDQKPSRAHYSILHYG